MKNNPEYIPTEGLSIKKDQQLAKLLSLWTGGRLSTPVFTHLAGMIPQPIVELVLFRENGDVLETLFIPRPEDDIVWPGMFHTPGTAIRTADYYRKDQQVLNGAFERLKKEIKADFTPPTFVDRLHRLVERGPEVVEIYVTRLLEESEINPKLIWYPVDQLATNPKFIQNQLGHINIAANFYRTHSPILD